MKGLRSVLMFETVGISWRFWRTGVRDGILNDVAKSAALAVTSGGTFYSWLV